MDPRPRRSTSPPLDASNVPNSGQSQTPCSSILTTITPLAGHFGQTKTLHKSAYTTTGLDSRAMSKTTAIVYPFPRPNRAPQTLRTSQATFRFPEKPWNSISMDFIEKLLSFIRLYLDPSMLIVFSKQSLFIPDLRYITSPHLHNYSFYTSLQAWCPSPRHFPSWNEFVSISFLSLGTALDMKSTSLLDISRRRCQTERTEPDSRTVPFDLLQHQQTIGSELLH